MILEKTVDKDRSHSV